MYKIFAVIASVFAVLSIISFSFFHVKDNKKFDKEVNDAIKELVEQVIQVQYKTHSEETLKNILTKELKQNLEDYHPNFFRKESLYFVNKNYMSTLRYSDETKEWSVSVRIHEGLFEDSFWLVVSIIQKEDGTYVISFIGRDK